HEFREHFEKMEVFKTITDSKGQKIHLKKLEKQVLCVSESRAEKEQAMHDKKVTKTQSELEALGKSIASGRLKDRDTIRERIGKIKGKCSGFDKIFELEFSEDYKKLTYKTKPGTDFYVGCYVIEHDGVDGCEETIWRLYTTLTKVENAFRCMKTDLGTRPVYHQGAERTKGHLFLSILAYHMLANIDHRLLKQGSPMRWNKIRETLQSHRRSVVQWKDSNGQA
ncbi:uncharacterized protein METZ01_LOCUS428515, partial [marine metagenome]